MKNNKLFYEIFKFCVTGFISFFIDYLFLIICMEILNFGIFFSSALAYIISTIVNYMLSINWVFTINGDNSKNKNFLLFTIFSLAGLLLTELIMWYGCRVLLINYLIVKILAVSIVMVFNYITRKIFLK